MDLDASSLCILCNKTNAQFCKRCKSTCYCSKECQQTDWPTHKLCASFPSFDPLSRPSNEHFRAILFSVDDTKPKFIWLYCKWLRNEDDYDKYQSSEVLEGWKSSNILLAILRGEKLIITTSMLWAIYLCVMKSFRRHSSHLRLATRDLPYTYSYESQYLTLSFWWSSLLRPKHEKTSLFFINFIPFQPPKWSGPAWSQRFEISQMEMP